MNPREFKLLTFDCYGTLIDWEAGIVAALRPWARQEGLEADDELLEAFGRSEHQQEQAGGAFRPYPEILKAVFQDIAREFGRESSPAAAEAFAGSVGDWPPFPDTIEALRTLKRRHRLLVVSNVDRASFSRTAQVLEVEFDAVVTAEDAGAYKPNPRMFECALEIASDWGIGPDSILHVAQSLYHDHLPAKQLGLRTVWVDRRKGKEGAGATPPKPDEMKPDWVVGSLAELVKLEDSGSGKQAHKNHRG